ncbi:hypothetical protein RAC92_20545 [Agrobacterium sp. CR_3]|uniref:hypothetical protein n=1 Tax=unclassified Agrobacterium TaxID=2632611 RepID=UPI0035C1C57B
MRYAVILRTTNDENPVFESDDITRCLGWIADQAKTDPTMAKEEYRVVDRDFEQSVGIEQDEQVLRGRWDITSGSSDPG